MVAELWCALNFSQNISRDFLWELFRFGSTVGFEFTLVINFYILNLTFLPSPFASEHSLTIVSAFYAQLILEYQMVFVFVYMYLYVYLYFDSHLDLYLCLYLQLCLHFMHNWFELPLA